LVQWDLNLWKLGNSRKGFLEEIWPSSGKEAKTRNIRGFPLRI
jgi:hypothetical protein